MSTDRPQTPQEMSPGVVAQPAGVQSIRCVLCHDQPLPGFQCYRCGTRTPGQRPAGNKGPTGQAVRNSDVQQAVEALAELTRRRDRREAERRAETERYEQQRALHTEHAQTRGTHRRMLSKP